jgi:hypothetical protein
MDLDKGLREIQEMLALTPTQRLERLVVEVNAWQILVRTIERIGRAGHQATLAGS